MISIHEFIEKELDCFVDYLTLHLSENGKNGEVIFQPISKNHGINASQLRDKFQLGLIRNYGEPGWRKLWLAKNEAGQIVGHVDIRSYPDQNSSHRVLLGMGVDSKYRGIGIGLQLLEFAINYCDEEERISWLDLQVMTNNQKAINLYSKKGFMEVGKIDDMFRIDNVSFGSTSMTLNVS
ncbi:GNAT family N-acetyltransferase [Flammeovirga sp. EKP202]|uniref:GNAT family N-acetyltransferase n=1 Tax=Flammeovirga sp. EKP202 TaxID=2770592 RepID=UPI00165F0E79|nr:GNAT family N-acetyltransferase [Flammeovirga sp. EKP202]MBD0402344.1 GNAT family N-acetyltransferase [Flammeovirga sp. EKP202]